MNNYHKIIGSSIFGFDDFSVLKIEGKYAEDLKGNYETFSQFMNIIPEKLWNETFIVWEGYIDELAESNSEKKIFFYDGRLRPLQPSEFLSLTKRTQLGIEGAI